MLDCSALSTSPTGFRLFSLQLKAIISSNFFLFEDVKKGILYEIVTVASSVVIFAFFKLGSSFNILIKDL